MLCDNCGRDGARQRLVTHTLGKGDNLLIVEGVPVISCRYCGESYMTLDTLRELERLKREERVNAIKKEVGVVTFA
ncbi:MAG: type II toxin-antitoxin system MqsA family antitoxin [Calditrichaeota bacterium]|nr:type II toxin-antitoxin system MqsA family antitoxin [Calditrichota bacterium]